MGYNARKLLVMAAIFFGPTIFAKSITFNLVASNGCQLDQVSSSSPYKEGVTYKPAPPSHIDTNSSTSFKVDIVPSKIPYNTNSELLSGFDLHYTIACPLSKKTGLLSIRGSYYYWYYIVDIFDNSGWSSSQYRYSGSGGYYDYTKRIDIK